MKSLFKNNIITRKTQKLAARTSLSIVGLIFLGATTPVNAQVGITSLDATYQTGTSSSYDTTVANPCSTSNYPSGCNSNINMQFGNGTANDLKLSGFNVGTQSYSLIQLADSVAFRRVNGQGATGERQLVFFEYNTNNQIKSSYTNTMAEAMLSTIINRGIDNAFSNDNSTGSNNIERIDYIISAGLAVPSANLGDIGFLILERGGNDPFKIAAITSLDANGKPSSFGPLKSVATTTWGKVGPNIQTAVMRREETETAFRPSHLVGSQTISGVYVSIASLDVPVGEKIYGYALFPNDITASNDLINLTDFPTNTSGASGAGGLDLMAGGGIFMLNSLTTISGTLYEDTDGDNNLGGTEAKLPANITVNLLDNSNNIIATANTDANGDYTFTGVSNGDYKIQVDTTDSEIPTGYTLGTPNDLSVTVSGSAITNQNFGFDKFTNPNVLLIKRITKINDGTTTNSGDNLAIYNQDEFNPYDDNKVEITELPQNESDPKPDTDKWVDTTSDTSSTFLIGGINGGKVKPDDEIEYTIYFLSTGDTEAKSVLVCDRVPSNVTFIPNSFNNQPQATEGLQNSDRGILWFKNGITQSLTNVKDGDAAQYFPPGVEPSTVYPNINCDDTNTNGAVVVNLQNLPNATAPGTPNTSYGFIRFRGRVK